MMSSGKSQGLDLTSSPPIFILPTRLKPDELHEAEDALHHAGSQLTYRAQEAKIFLGRVTQKKRAAFDLRAQGVWTEEVAVPKTKHGRTEKAPSRKRRKVDHQQRKDSDLSNNRSPASGSESSGAEPSAADTKRKSSEDFWPDLTENIIVLKLAWLDACLQQSQRVPYQPYVVYVGKVIPKPPGETSPPSLPHAVDITARHHLHDSDRQARATRSTPQHDDKTTILERARADAPEPSSNPHSSRRRLKGGRKSPPLTRSRHPPKLHHTTTSDVEDLDYRSLPELPDWARHEYNTYSCLRDTPMHPANKAFIAQLTKIKDARTLTLDYIGVRAYSTSIASLAAYPHYITNVLEITRLPGCNEKIARLWSEWYASADDDGDRYIQTVRDLDGDTDLQHLRLFWEIWGVGPDTARKFYFEHGWKDIDDIVEFGWTSLTRVQQIGVKFYDEFKVKIPRQEVKEIGDVILQHARRCRKIPEAAWGTPADIVCVIVGGYRRGKDLSGDVDVIISHHDEDMTMDLVVDVVRSLEQESWVTHTLTLHTTTSDRGQQTLPYRSDGSRGHGFDTLDKALCVWQDPHFDDENGTITKNPNIHRRVDIIISAWRTVGCAVLGWSGATTFERDIRRFVKKTRGWKFDSSGVRDRSNGLVLNLEAPKEGDPGDTWQDRERRLMDALGIGFREPTLRCTG